MSPGGPQNHTSQFVPLFIDYAQSLSTYGRSSKPYANHFLNMHRNSWAKHSRADHMAPKQSAQNHVRSLQYNQETKQIHMSFSPFLWLFPFLKFFMQIYPELQQQQKIYINVLEFSLRNSLNMDKTHMIFWKE